MSASSDGITETELERVFAAIANEAPEGKLRTGHVTKIFSKTLDFTEYDSEPSPSRTGEERWEQHGRNIISHGKEKHFWSYDEDDGVINSRNNKEWESWSDKDINKFIGDGVIASDDPIATVREEVQKIDFDAPMRNRKRARPKTDAERLRAAEEGGRRCEKRYKAPNKGSHVRDPRVRDNVIKSDTHKNCEWCGKPPRTLQDGKTPASMRCHHVIPFEQGGADNKYNVVLIHPGCHSEIHDHENLPEWDEIVEAFQKTIAARLGEPLSVIQEQSLNIKD